MLGAVATGWLRGGARYSRGREFRLSRTTIRWPRSALRPNAGLYLGRWPVSTSRVPGGRW